MPYRKVLVVGHTCRPLRRTHQRPSIGLIDTSAIYLFILASDSHLHIWGEGKPPFPYASGQEPPERLRESCGPETLIQEMDDAGIGGALIVQVSYSLGVTKYNRQQLVCRL